MQQAYKFYEVSKDKFLKRHKDDYRWKRFYVELDKEMNNDIELEKKLEYVRNTKGEESEEYKEIQVITCNNFNKWFDRYIMCGNFINLLSRYSITLDDDDIEIWNESIKITQYNFRDLSIFKKVAFRRIDYSKKCKCCGGVWKSEERILSDKCSPCSAWEIIFDMYEIAYERDSKFIYVLESIKELVYSKEFYTPKSYDFRKKLEDRGIRIDSNIERIWNLANDELGMQNISKVGRWEYYSPTEKIGNGVKSIFGSLFK